MSRTETFHNMGFRLTYPELFDDTLGQIGPMAFGDQGDGLYFMMFSYIAVSNEDMKAIQQKTGDGELSEEDKQRVAGAMGSLLVVIGAAGKQGPKEIIGKLQMGYVTEDCFTEVGRYRDIVYYAVVDPESDASFMQTIEPAFAEEFQKLQPVLIEALKKAEYMGPEIPGADLVGKRLQFETRDMDGHPVRSEELFGAHAVTMINVWATWCGPCKQELEELGNIHRRLAAKDAAIIGICDDGRDQAEKCRRLMQEKHLSYLNVLPYEGMDELGVEGFPTSFFVDREGRILTPPIIGVPGDISEYEKRIDSLLAQKPAEEQPAPAPAAAEKQKACRVRVTDEAGSPVAGAAVQFCSDTSCMMGRTDAEGTAAFPAEKGTYTVHVQKVPEGFASCSEEFAVPEDLGDVRIMLKRI